MKGRNSAMEKKYVLKDLTNKEFNILAMICGVNQMVARDILDEVNIRLLHGITAYDYQHHFIGVENTDLNKIDRIMNFLTKSEIVKTYVETGRIVLCTAPEFDDLWNKHKF